MANAVWTCGFAGAALVLALGAASPALALEDGKGSPLDALMGVLGVSPDKDDDAIQYRDRAPLVVPPKTELRQPLPPPAARTAAWPQDQELIRAKKRAEERRARAPENVSAQDIRNTGRIDPRDQKERPGAPQACDMDPFNRSGCSQTEYWNRLATDRMGDTGSKKRDLQAGVEPPRDYLTQPPKGYMAPKNTVKTTTFEPRHTDEEDIRDFFRKKPNPDE
jgi:hypothetical protein